jgi:hypothetical protein
MVDLMQMANERGRHASDRLAQFRTIFHDAFAIDLPSWYLHQDVRAGRDRPIASEGTPKCIRAHFARVFAMNEPDESDACDGLHRPKSLQNEANDTIELSIGQKRVATGVTIREAVLLEMGPIDPDCLRVDREQSSDFLVRNKPSESDRLVECDP